MPATPFIGLLFAGDASPSCPLPEASWRDLHLDQVRDALTVDRERYQLADFLAAPLGTAAAVVYRLEVFHDLERADTRQTLAAFTKGMRAVQSQLTGARQLHHEQGERRWHLNAVDHYLRVLALLHQELQEQAPTSCALWSLMSWLEDYLAQPDLVRLRQQSAQLLTEVAALRFAVLTHGGRITVGPYDDEPDYAHQVATTFSRFREAGGAGRTSAPQPRGGLDRMDTIVLDLVAKVFPDVFRRVADFREVSDNFIDPMVSQVEREAELYLAYCDLMDRAARSGATFCLPTLDSSGTEEVLGATDLALGLQLLSRDGMLVPNDYRLIPPERILAISGPNQGGKSTMARLFGQLHYLAALGLPVPAESARLTLCDGAYTHFERAESIASLAGKLEEELIRVRDVLQVATDRSVIVLNETFGSTTLQDATALGREILLRILKSGSLAVYVTFVDELTSIDPAVVSMMSIVDPDSIERRTFKVIRRPADGRAYAKALADHYGLSYAAIREGIS